MAEEHEWRLEKYSDELDPFASVHWFVMQGNLVIAQCEVEAHATRIIVEHERHVIYEQALEHITGMSSASHDLEAAIAAALRALDTRE